MITFGNIDVYFQMSNKNENHLHLLGHRGILGQWALLSQGSYFSHLMNQFFVG